MDKISRIEDLKFSCGLNFTNQSAFHLISFIMLGVFGKNCNFKNFAWTKFRENGQNTRKSRKLIHAKFNPLKVIIMSTIKHGSFVNETDFCSRNFLKIAGTANFRWKNSISWVSRAVLYIFSWNSAHWCKMPMSKIWPSPIFEKRIFPAENAGNMPEKLVFWPFFEISSLVFSIFLHRDA